jgi:hypothetical protein
MKRLSVALALIALFASLSLAQNDSYAYGQPSDLKGLKKVYVDSGPDTKSRDKIIKDLENAKLGFEIADDEKDAEILLGYGAGAVSRKVVGSVVGSSVIMREKTQRTGVGIVVALNARGKDRVVHSFEDVQNSKWERNPVDNYVREFIKVYKKGNDLK